jgi:hypothetical protein
LEKFDPQYKGLQIKYLPKLSPHQSWKELTSFHLSKQIEISPVPIINDDVCQFRPHFFTCKRLQKADTSNCKYQKELHPVAHL